VLVQNREEKFWLAPPQFYELSRLLNFAKFDDLKRFASARSLLGTRTWMPYLINVQDGEISIYPQDDLYPSDPDYSGKDLERVKFTSGLIRVLFITFNRTIDFGPFHNNGTLHYHTECLVRTMKVFICLRTNVQQKPSITYDGW